jgi:hypothetical protein
MIANCVLSAIANTYAAWQKKLYRNNLFSQNQGGLKKKPVFSTLEDYIIQRYGFFWP